MLRTALIGLALGLNCFAYDYVPLQDRAQAQSLVGGTLLNESIYSNPAGSSFTNVYSVGLDFQSKDDLSVSVLDTKTSSFGGALGYFRNSVPFSNKALQGAKLGFSGRLTQGVGVGLAGKTVWGVGTNHKDVDVGFLFNFNVVQLGATFKNILGGKKELSMDREWAIGARMSYQQLVFLSASAHSKWENFAPYQYGIGMEYSSPYRFSIKGGYRFQPSYGTSYWSVGASINSPKVSFHYGLEIPNQDVSYEGISESLAHVFGITALL